MRTGQSRSTRIGQPQRKGVPWYVIGDTVMVWPQERAGYSLMPLKSKAGIGMSDITTKNNHSS